MCRGEAPPHQLEGPQLVAHPLPHLFQRKEGQRETHQVPCLMPPPADAHSSLGKGSAPGAETSRHLMEPHPALHASGVGRQLSPSQGLAPPPAATPTGGSPWEVPGVPGSPAPSQPRHSAHPAPGKHFATGKRTRGAPHGCLPALSSTRPSLHGPGHPTRDKGPSSGWGAQASPSGAHLGVSHGGVPCGVPPSGGPSWEAAAARLVSLSTALLTSGALAPLGQAQPGTASRLQSAALRFLHAVQRAPLGAPGTPPGRLAAVREEGAPADSSLGAPPNGMPGGPDACEGGTPRMHPWEAQGAFGQGEEECQDDCGPCEMPADQEVSMHGNGMDTVYWKGPWVHQDVPMGESAQEVEGSLVDALRKGDSRDSEGVPRGLQLPAPMGQESVGEDIMGVGAPRERPLVHHGMAGKEEGMQWGLRVPAASASLTMVSMPSILGSSSTLSGPLSSLSAPSHPSLAHPLSPHSHASSLPAGPIPDHPTDWPQPHQVAPQFHNQFTTRSSSLAPTSPSSTAVQQPAEEGQPHQLAAPLCSRLRRPSLAGTSSRDQPHVPAVHQGSATWLTQRLQGVLQDISLKQGGLRGQGQDQKSGQGQMQGQDPSQGQGKMQRQGWMPFSRSLFEVFVPCHAAEAASKGPPCNENEVEGERQEEGKWEGEVEGEGEGAGEGDGKCGVLELEVGPQDVLQCAIEGGIPGCSPRYGVSGGGISRKRTRLALDDEAERCALPFGGSPSLGAELFWWPLTGEEERGGGKEKEGEREEGREKERVGEVGREKDGPRDGRSVGSSRGTLDTPILIYTGSSASVDAGRDAGKSEGEEDGVGCESGGKGEGVGPAQEPLADCGECGKCGKCVKYGDWTALEEPRGEWVRSSPGEAALSHWASNISPCIAPLPFVTPPLDLEPSASSPEHYPSLSPSSDLDSVAVEGSTGKGSAGEGHTGEGHTGERSPGEGSTEQGPCYALYTTVHMRSVVVTAEG